MKRLILAGAMGWLVTLAIAMAPLAFGEGSFCIPESGGQPRCEMIVTSSGSVFLEVCVKNNGTPGQCSGGKTRDPIMTLSLKCNDGNPTPVEIAKGETKCISCYLKEAKVCIPSQSCEACGDWTSATP